MTVVARGAKVVAYDIVVRDDANVVIGRARLEVGGDKKHYVLLQQIRGGDREGTLNVPLRCDYEVLKAIVDEIKQVDDFLPKVDK